MIKDRRGTRTRSLPGVTSFQDTGPRLLLPSRTEQGRLGPHRAPRLRSSTPGKSLTFQGACSSGTGFSASWALILRWPCAQFRRLVASCSAPSEPCEPSVTLGTPTVLKPSTNQTEEPRITRYRTESDRSTQPPRAFRRGFRTPRSVRQSIVFETSQCSGISSSVRRPLAG